jgi:hypothetical protein
MTLTRRCNCSRVGAYPPPRNVAAEDLDGTNSLKSATLWGGVGGGTSSWIALSFLPTRERLPRRQFARYVSLAVTLLIALTTAARSGATDDEFRRLVQSDWQSQEKRWGRKPEDPESIRQALSRGERLGRHLSSVEHAPDVTREVAELEELRRQAGDLQTLKGHQRLALYRQIRSLTRNMALKNPVLGDHPIVFMKRRRFICQMLHEYLGYFYDYGDIAGGGLYVLTRPGHSLQIQKLTDQRLPRGNFTTLALSYDACTEPPGISTMSATGLFSKL